MIRTRKLLTVTAALVMSVLLLASCGDNSTDATSAAQAPVESAPSQAIRIDIQGQEVWFDPTLANYATTTPLMTSEFPMEFSMGEYTGWDVTINGVPVTNGETSEIKIEKLSKDAPVSIEFTNQATGETTYQTINTLPDYVFYSYGQGDGMYYFTKGDFFYKMNGSGEIVFYGSGEEAKDFKPYSINGETYYSVTVGAGGFQLDDVQGTEWILDENYKIIDTVEYLIPSEGIPANQKLDVHEFRMLDVGHYIVTSYVPKRVTNIPSTVANYSPFGARVIAAVVQEIKDGELLFQWDSTEHAELYAFSEQGNDYSNLTSYYGDYAHLNSVEIDPTDDNLLLSLRNLSAVIKVDRATGEIIWILGGPGDQFGLTEEQKFSAQHYARISDRGTITIFDNGMPELANPAVDKYNTRVVEYTLDEENKSLLSFKEYVVPGTNSPIMGSAELLDPETDTFLIGWGGRRTGTPLFSEVNFSTNEVIFEVFDKDTNFVTGSYRAYKSAS